MDPNETTVKKMMLFNLVVCVLTSHITQCIVSSRGYVVRTSMRWDIFGHTCVKKHAGK